MQYKCETCYDTGSRDQIGTYLDCNECSVAQTRRDLNDFVKSLGPTHPEDVALAIHQRALAMAPKQEAPTQDCGACLGSGWVSRDQDIGTEQECFSCDGSGKSDDVAPAAANGALTDAAAWKIITDIVGTQGISWQGNMAACIETEDEAGDIARAILAAAGPDAALVALINKAQSILAHHLPPDGPDAKTTISALLGLLDGPESRAALSGAKVN